MFSRFRASLFCLLALPLCASGQNYIYQTGNPTFSTQIPVEHGFVNVNNGDVHLEIPIASVPQRGGVLNLNARLVYDSRIWKIVKNGSSYSWMPTNVPNSLGGWLILTGGETGSGITSSTYGYSNQYEGGVDRNGNFSYCNNTSFYYNNFAWTDPIGTTHVFNEGWNQENWPCEYQNGYDVGDGPQSNAGYAIDGSGLILSMSGYQGSSPDQLAYTVRDKNGTQLYPSIVDRNGNAFSQDANGNTVDSRGNTPVIETSNGNQIYLDVMTASGTRARYTITTEQISYSTQFLQSGVQDMPGSFTAIQSVQLPDGSQYQFNYDTAPATGPYSPYHYGEVTSMTLPTGGVVNYQYGVFSDSFQNENRWVTAHTADGGTTKFAPATVSQCSSSQSCQEKATITSPDGNDTVYTFSLDAGQFVNAASWNTGVTAYNGAAGGTQLVSSATNYNYNTVSYVDPSTGRATNFQQALGYTVTNTLADAGVASQTQNTIDSKTGYLTDTKNWNYQAGSFAAQPDQDTAYTYQQDASGRINGPLNQTTVTDGAGNRLSQTTYDYNGLTPTGQHQWINTSGTTLDTTVNYDGAGTPLYSTAPEGKTTYGHDATDTFVTAVTPPTPSSGAAIAAQTAYDGATGAVTSTTDPNGKATTYKMFDAFNRPGEVDFPDGGVTKVSYPSATMVNESTAFDSAGPGTTMRQNDAYGRPSRTAVDNTGQGTTFYQQDTCYDSSGRVNFQSYRYQGAGFSVGKACSGVGDSYTYDPLGRVKQVTHGDGSTIQYSYRGRAVQITDENNVSKITQTDAFSRITTACEITSDTTMPASGSPASCGTDIGGTGFATNYSYNPAAFQTTVIQGAQTRVFTADSLGRQVSAREPESGTTTYGYAYNGTGLLVTRTKPMANQTSSTALTTTQTQYDSLDRIVSVTYSDGTAAKSYSYDVPAAGTNSANVVGRLAQQRAATAAGAAVEAFGYDAMGRTTLVTTCTPSTCGKATATQNYTYDFAGNMTGATDGVGATLIYGYTPANENAGVGSLLGSYPAAIVSNVANGPNGPTSYQLGNGVNQVYRYDGLGRRDGGWVCSGSTSTFCTGGTQLYGYTITMGGSRVNQACDTVLGNCSTMTYDDLGRLKMRTTTSGNNLNGNWTYDRYGNRWSQTVSPSGYQQQIPVNSANNQAVGFSYDAAGNLQADTAHSYTYDAEGNMIAVDGGKTAKYYFDAGNNRVRVESTGGPIPGMYEYLYNLTGQKVAITSGGGVAEEDTHLGTRPLAVFFNGSLSYEHQDWVGTERFLTSSTGSAIGNYTSLPFGDGYVDNGYDLDPYHYAGLEHDYESTLDHATFREYQNAGGRWLSPDPYQGSEDFTNPQSWNRYSYVLNDPLSLSDPTGQDGGSICASAGAATAASGIGAGVGIGICTAGIVFDAYELLKGLFGGSPSFHGSLKPRPNGSPLDEHNIIYGPNIAGALGLPDQTCEFGPCGGGISSATGNSQIGNASVTIQQIKLYATVGYELAQAVLKFNGICSEGAFGYAGAQGKAGFGGYLGNLDTATGFSNNVLFENRNAGVAFGGEATEGLYFLPLGEIGGGLVAFTKSGYTFGGYVGTPETTPVGVGLGSYMTANYRKHCSM